MSKTGSSEKPILESTFPSSAYEIGMRSGVYVKATGKESHSG